MYVIWLTLLCASYLVNPTACFATGAPESVCSTMIPQHSGILLGSDTYDLTLSQSIYNPGDTIQVTLSTNNSDGFKGFLIAARRVSGATDILGTFSPINNTHVVCSGISGNAVTHSDSEVKSSVTFNWTAPAEFQGDLVFQFTAVKHYTEYYLSKNSTILKANSFAIDEKCGQGKGCYGECVNNGCRWEISWLDSDNYYNITMKSVITDDNKYIALGFSNMSAMGPGSIVSCVVVNQSISIRTGYTLGHRYTPLNQHEDIIQNENNSLVDGVLICNFQRVKETTSNNTFNLTEPWFLIVARGDANATHIIRHSRIDRYVTNQRIDLSNTNQEIIVPTLSPPPTTTVTTTTAPSINVTTSTLTTSTSKPAGHFAKDPGCGVTKGCYSDCSSGLCDWELSWWDAGDNYNITLQNYYLGDNRWVALGFTAAAGDAMDAASVVSCIAHNGKVDVKISVNKGYDNSPLSNPTEGITNQQNSYVNGVIRCSFSRAKESNNNDVYNLTQSSWYLITAIGSAAADGTMNQHDAKNRRVTDDKIDISSKSTDISWSPPGPTTEPVTAKPGKFTKDPDCGSKKGCYSNCKNDECDLLLSWSPKGNNFEITLKSKTSSTGNQYIALGFSTSAKMSSASVVACTVYQQTVDVFISKNSGYSNTPLTNPKEGITLISGSYKDGLLECTFTRETSSANNSEIYDLTKPWNLITARGTAGQGGRLSAHDGSNRFFTSSQIDFRDTSVDISLETSDYPLIKAHGCLMVIAWMISASIGLGFARFLKPLWPDYMPCGVKVWFAVHRGTMVLAFLFGCAGFILVFVEVKDYSEIVGEDYKKAHPILGIITTSLLVINPFMSLLRCAPDHPKRPIFNWAHRSVGTIAHILSIVTITTGLYLPKAQVDSSTGLVIMIIYASWHLVFFLTMSLLDALAIADKSKVYKSTLPGVELTSQKTSKLGSQYTLNALDGPSDSDKPKSNEPPKSLAKKFLIVFHVAVLCGLSIAILYLIIDGNQ